jgi:hypothetical protein
VRCAHFRFAQSRKEGDSNLSIVQKPFLGYRAEGIVKFVGIVPHLGKRMLVGLELLEAIGEHDGEGYFQTRSALVFGTWLQGCIELIRK